MPELPEVERAANLVRQYCTKKEVTAVIARESGGGPRTGEFDDIVVADGCTESQLVKALKNKVLLKVHRKGKQMWFELGASPKKKAETTFVLFHFGMTGSFSIKGAERLTFHEFKVSEDWPPRFCKLEIQFGDICLAFTDPRRLGRVRLRIDPLNQPPISKLGSDPIHSPAPIDAFKAAISKRKPVIKALLLDQEGIFCGIGNWIADEVLYQSKIHPASPGNSLSEEQLERLHAAILSVCKHAVSVDADSASFPKTWLFHYRWSKGKEPQKLPNGNKITFETVGGRTSAIVVAEQKKGQATKVEAKENNGKAVKQEKQGKAVKQEKQGKAVKQEKQGKAAKQEKQGNAVKQEKQSKAGKQEKQGNEVKQEKQGKAGKQENQVDEQVVGWFEEEKPSATRRRSSAGGGPKRTSKRARTSR
jgi:formamidopyrimidine-DNA glycosylase